jgi:hypothetical protein
MKRIVVAWFISPLLFGTAAYFYLSADDSMLQWFSPSSPKLEVRDYFEFGECELGESIRTPVTLANRGNRELLIDRVKAGCSCTWLERVDNGQPIESLQLAPGASIELFLRLNARVKEVGSPLRAVITLSTNDPHCTEARIEAYIPKVKGGVTAWPSSIAFGAVRNGSKARQVVEIRDHAIHSRKVARVVSSDPECIAVHLLPFDRVQDRSESVIARCEVILHARKIGPFEGKVAIYLADEDRPPDEVSITGRVVGSVELLPAVVVLPRVSSNGRLYHAECSCRAADGERLTLAVHSVPSDLQVKIIPGVDSNSQNIRIEWVPRQHDRVKESVRQTVQLDARVGEEDTLIEIPVICRGNGERP